MADSSRLHGLHQDAKKLMTIGLPPFDKVAESTVRPARSFIFTEGRAAETVDAVSATAAASMIDRKLNIGVKNEK